MRQVPQTCSNNTTEHESMYVSDLIPATIVNKHASCGVQNIYIFNKDVIISVLGKRSTCRRAETCRWFIQPEELQQLKSIIQNVSYITNTIIVHSNRPDTNNVVIKSV